MSYESNILRADIGRVTRRLNKFFRSHDCHCRFADEFSYIYSKNLIYYTLIITDQASNDFTTFVKKNYDIDIDIFALSILHELGHHYTLDEIDDRQYFSDSDEKEEIEKAIHAKEASANTITELNYKYFNLFVEKTATDWAIDYYLNNKEEVDMLMEDVNNILSHMYGCLLSPEQGAC